MNNKQDIEKEIMQIETWKGDWGLPSVDFDCLQALALIKFANAPVKNTPTNNPFWSKKNSLPIFRHEDTCLYSLRDIQNYLSKKGFNVDTSLSNKDLAAIIAYTNLIKHKLEPALNYIWWVDEKNYTELFRKWYAKALPFPFNFFYPGYYERQAKRYIDVMFPDIDKKEIIETYLFGEAEKCLSTLSSRLGDMQYFFGRMPTSLDAVVYGHLAPLLKAPLPSTFLQNHLKACTNLVNFVERITKQYFHDVRPENVKQPKSKPTAAPNETTKKTEEDFPNATRNKFIATLIASVAMLGYAFVHGMLPFELQIIRDDSYEEDEQ